jgi:hypothetical protein
MRTLLYLLVAFLPICGRAALAIGFNTPATMYGLVGWWPMNQDSGTTVIDRSGLTNTAVWHTLNGTFPTPVWSKNPAVLPWSIRLDGPTAQHWFSCTNAGIMLTNDFSASLWINTIAQGSSTPVILCNGTAASTGWNLQIIATYGIQGYTSQTGVNQITTTGNNAIAINTWAFVCVTRHLTSLRIYVNGLDMTTSAASHLDPTPRTGEFRIGDYFDSGAYFAGYVNDVRIYNRVLTTNEIGHLYTQFQ